MKKILFLLLLLITACSKDDEPVFKIQDTFFESRFNKFVEVATYFNVTVPRNNMILRFVEDGNNNINDSKTHREGDQLYVDIDKDFSDVYFDSDATEINLFQNLAHGLLATPFRDCGIMKKITTPEDVPDYSLGYDHYANLFDASSPCVE